ncbi:hypothetical protein [uncultured Flavobacterium sp.]|uniref:hypothetical protein n=1 Tax=uncultured Flavobacterium sp. TaxID=165435 RepID=UPI0030EF4337|tara:strand:- start:7280 stop:7861 length:582 start_codon:yes stop_codon:yes gene_type:complete
MKYLVLILFFTISTFSQDIKNDSIQINWINHANLCLNFKDNINAFSSFKNAYLENKTNDLGSLAYKKLDSLNRVIKLQLLNDISGNWEINSSGSNWGTSNDKLGLINIKDSLIFFKFYDKDSSLNEYLKNSKLELSLDDFLNYNYEEFTFDNKTIWRIYLKNDKLYFTELGKKTEEGRSLMVCGNFFMECIRK